MSLLALSGTNSVSGGGYEIDNSTKFEADNTERMYRAWGGSGGGNDQTWTVSLWVKRTELGTLQHIWGAGTSGNDVLLVSFLTDNTLKFRSTKAGANDCVYVTNRVFRDTNAWYHIVTAVDTTSGTAGDRLRIYINGVEETSFSTETNFNQNDNTLHNANNSYMEIATAIGEADRFCGYIAEVISISGSQLAPTTFGETDSDTGIWIPKQYSGSFPQNSVFLEFKDSSSLGTDTSGNGQTFTLQNISATDQATDTPTNNFATFNPLSTFAGSFVVSDGAAKIQQASGQSGYKTHCATIGVTVGKWYAEFKAGTGWAQGSVGVNQLEDSKNWEEGYIGQYSNSTAIGMGYMNDGQFSRNGGTGAIGSTYTAGDIIGIALLINANGTGFMGMHKNGTWQNSQDPSSGTTGMLGLYYGNALPDGMFHTFAVTTRHDNGPWLANFGGYSGFTISSGNSDANGYGNFEYAVPTGYYALCTKNLAEFG